MRVGAFLPTYWTDYGATTVREAVEEAARAAQALGYASVWANDHVVAPLRHAGGVDYLICDFVADGVDDLLRQMQVMAEQIMPALASSS